MYHDTLYLGWAGKDWADEQAPPGTVAAYFLETTVLVAFMLVGLVGWLVYLLVDPARERPVPYRAAGRATR